MRTLSEEYLEAVDAISKKEIAQVKRLDERLRLTIAERESMHHAIAKSWATQIKWLNNEPKYRKLFNK
jgi:hypothetical protein